jgi:hypothetical protein
VKPLDEFVRNAGQASGRDACCKPCHNVRGKAAKDKVGGARTHHLKRRYGITAEAADAMQKEQGGHCAICTSAPAAHVDHDAETSAVRALLCLNCNGGLGQFKDDPSLVHAAAHYVSLHHSPSRGSGTRGHQQAAEQGQPPVGRLDAQDACVAGPPPSGRATRDGPTPRETSPPSDHRRWRRLRNASRSGGLASTGPGRSRLSVEQ